MFSTYNQIEEWLHERTDLRTVISLLQQAVAEEAVVLLEKDMIDPQPKKGAPRRLSLLEDNVTWAKKHFLEEINEFLSLSVPALTPWQVLGRRRTAKAWAVATIIHNRLLKESE